MLADRRGFLGTLLALPLLGLAREPAPDDGGMDIVGDDVFSFPGKPTSVSPALAIKILAEEARSRLKP